MFLTHFLLNKPTNLPKPFAARAFSYPKAFLVFGIERMTKGVYRGDDMLSMKTIPLSRPDITKKEVDAVLGVLKTPNLSLGPKLREFEQDLADFVGVKYAIAVNSGTSGLHLIVRALGIKRGDEVITTPFSFIASSNCILFEGAIPVFVDIKSDTLNIDPDLIEGSITPRTKAILAVDVFGYPADWGALKKIARKHNLKLIEDSAEAIGSEFKGKKCGSFGDAAILSFYPNKQITTGEGGVILTNNKRIAEFSLSTRNQGREVKIQRETGRKFGHKSILEHMRLGYNYRISDINSALGVAQLARIRELMERRKRVFELYTERLCQIPELRLPHVESNVKVNWFVYVVGLPSRYRRKDRDRVIKKLKERGVQASNYFPCIHLQPFYQRSFGYRKGSFPVAEYASDRALALPFYNTISSRDVDFVTKTLREILS